MMVSAGEATILRREIERTWAEVATVYVRSARDAGSQYTVVAKTGLHCSLEQLGRQRENAQSAPLRNELAASRILKWEAVYTMPANAQVEIGGRRWQFKDSTIDLRVARPGSQPLYWIAEVMRVPT